MAVALAAGAAAALAGASLAFAAFTGFSVDQRATLQRDGSVVVTGTVECTSGDTVTVQPELLQAHAQLVNIGLGSTDVTCTGSPQTWSATVTSELGLAFKPGHASSVAFAFDNTDFTSSPTAAQVLHITP